VCASEGGTCECDGSVQYGADGRFSKMVDAGTTNKVVCNTNTFGGDPARNVLKQCYCSAGLRVAKGIYNGGRRDRRSIETVSAKEWNWVDEEGEGPFGPFLLVDEQTASTASGCKIAFCSHACLIAVAVS
jgi:hypothetical protein